MSLPRRAMEQMGFAVCCLLCDAEDIAGSNRCRECIDFHTKSREKLNLGTPKSKADRLAREFIIMLASPSKYIDDLNHGESMIYYASLIDKHHGINPIKTSEELGKRFEILRNRSKKSLIRDVANQNKWLDNPPDFFEREELLQLISDNKKTQPSSDWDTLLSDVNRLLNEENS